ncbi:MAG: hypothetical protein ABI645_02730 [Pseudomonadota bacterium]
MSDSQHNLDRRRFIAGGVAGVAAVPGADGKAGSQLELWATAPKASVILHDPRIKLPEDMQQRLGANGARTMMLEGDPMRLWRSDAGALLRDPSTTLMGVTGWADLLIFRGMAAETRRHLRYEKLDPATGTFIWLVA